MQYDNTNSGAAFLKENANPKAPKWKGDLNVEGKEYQIAVWEKKSKRGDDFLSFKVEKKGNFSPKPKQHLEEDAPF